MNSTNKQRLILISDLWGNNNSDWIIFYTSILENHFDLQFYDARDLAEIDCRAEIENIHQQFVNGGIEKAVSNLLPKEKNSVNVLAFSIGGTIAWKVALAGLKVDNLFAISSTRLRYETQKPDGIIKLYYGENDVYKPDENWFSTMRIKPRIYQNEDHEFYRKKEIAEEICEMIIKSKK